MNIQFQSYWLLYFLWVVPLMAVWWLLAKKKRERKIAEFMSSTMQTKLRPVERSRRFTTQLALFSCGIFLMLIALARPQWGTKKYKVYTRGRDLIIALDVSRSMLANDTHPNRLQRAKTDVMDLIRELKGDRAALLVFRHKAILRCPLTTDYAFLQQSLDAVTINSAPKGETDIGDAITKALDAFDNESGSHKAIILISDGEDLTGRAMDAADKAGKLNIPIFTVGLGSKNGSKIPEQGEGSDFVKFQGENVVTKLNHESLYNLAKNSGGAYIHAATANMDLGTLYKNHLKTITPQDLEETERTVHVERFQLFLIPGLTLMIAGCFFSLGRMTSGRQRKKDITQNESGFINGSVLKSGASVLLIVSSICLPHSSSLAQTNATSEAAPTTLSTPAGREGARMAQKLYRQGKFEEAANAYLEAAKRSTESSQRDFRYNAAISLYKAGAYKEAADMLRRESLSESYNISMTANALGTALYKAADPENASQTNIIETARLLKEAGESFKSSAQSDQSNTTAKDNLSVVLSKLPQIQEQAHLAKLMEKYGKLPAEELLFKMLNNQREITKGFPTIITNDSPSQITQFEDYASLQNENGDIWVPLKQKMLNSLAQMQNTSTNISQQQIQSIVENMDALQVAMKKSSEQLRDLDTAGFQSARASQAGVYRLWKSIAPYQQILQEDINLQSNLLSITESIPINEETEAMQNEGAELTELFSERFKAAVPATEQNNANQPDAEGQPSISMEDREKIINYADMAVTAQKLAAKHLDTKNKQMALQEEKKAYDILKEIEKLLPKNQDQNQQQDQDQNQQQNENQNQQQNEQEQQNQDEQQNQGEDQKEQPMKPEDTTPEEIKDLLEKALEREKEHEAEKQRRQNQVPMSPRERDW